VVHALLPSIYRSYAVELLKDRDSATTNPRTVSNVDGIPTTVQAREHRLVVGKFNELEVQPTVMDMPREKAHSSSPTADNKKRKNQLWHTASVYPQ
jgi:hypothetical protein